MKQVFVAAWIGLVAGWIGFGWMLQGAPGDVRVAQAEVEGGRHG